MTTAWAYLPNAPHIDRVLADLSARAEVWAAAWDAARDAAWDDARTAAWDTALDDARSAAWYAARDAAGDAAWAAAGGAAWDAAWGAAWDAARDADWNAARYAARDAIGALIAWDDCSELLDLPPDAVRLLAASGHHPAVLLYPAVLAFNTNSTPTND